MYQPFRRVSEWGLYVNPEAIPDMALVGLGALTLVAMLLFVRVDRPVHKLSTVGFYGAYLAYSIGIYEYLSNLPGLGL